MQNFKQGDDILLKVLVVEDEVAINLANTESVRCTLSVKNVVVDKFSTKVLSGMGNLQTPAGYKPLELDNAKSNQINLVLDNEVTQGYPVGALRAFVEVLFTDSTFVDGFRTEQYVVWVGAIEKGESPL